MVQFSVYAKYLPAAGRLLSIASAIKKKIPSGGCVRILTVSDRQWSHSVCYVNKTEIKSEETPEQLTIF